MGVFLPTSNLSPVQLSMFGDDTTWQNTPHNSNY